MVEFLIVVNFLNFLQISKCSKIHVGGARNQVTEMKNE
jgi:hypothetical protein